MTTPVEHKIGNSHIIEIDLASFVARAMATLNPNIVKVGVNQHFGYLLVSLRDYGQKSNGKTEIMGIDEENPSPESVFSRFEEEMNKIEQIKGSYRQTSKSSDSKGMVYTTWEKNDTHQ